MCVSQARVQSKEIICTSVMPSHSRPFSKLFAATVVHLSAQSEGEMHIFTVATFFSYMATNKTMKRQQNTWQAVLALLEMTQLSSFNPPPPLCVHSVGSLQPPDRLIGNNPTKSLQSSDNLVDRHPSHYYSEPSLRAQLVVFYTLPPVKTNII